MGASFSSFGCFVFDLGVFVFEFLGASFSSFGCFVFDVGCFVFEIWVLRVSVFVFECFVFETTLSVDIAGMDALSLNYWLSKFVMEVAKKSGGRYPPKTVYGIICALKRYLEEKNGSEALNPLDASDKR